MCPGRPEPPDVSVADRGLRTAVPYDDGVRFVDVSFFLFYFFFERTEILPLVVRVPYGRNLYNAVDFGRTSVPASARARVSG